MMSCLTVAQVIKARYGVYLKTWVGELVPQSSYESDGQPRGGGWGNVTNIVFDGVDVAGAARPFMITQDNGDNGSYSGTSNMLVSDVRLQNFYGTLSASDNTGTVSCSSRHPCYDIYLTNMTGVEGSGGATLEGSCKYTQSGGIHGLSDC